MPMACAASATSSRNGNMMRVSVTANANLPGTRANPDASSHTSCGLKTMPSTQIPPTTSSSAVATRFESSAGPGGITSPRCVGGGADGADQRHARTGEEYGLTSSQMFYPELCAKGRGGSSHRDPRSAVAAGAYGGGTE